MRYSPPIKLKTSPSEDTECILAKVLILSPPKFSPTSHPSGIFLDVACPSSFFIPSSYDTSNNSRWRYAGPTVHAQRRSTLQIRDKNLNATFRRMCSRHYRGIRIVEGES